MNKSQLLKLLPSLLNSNIEHPIKRLYQESLEPNIERLKMLVEKHNEDHKQLHIFSAAGRTELGGNHTDHNNGKVLAASVSFDNVGVVSKTDDNIATLDSTGFKTVVVDLNSCLEPDKIVKNTTEALIAGIAYKFKEQGLNIGGFRATTHSNIPQSAGLSSSAAIEIMIGKIFSCLYNEDKVGVVELAQWGQFAENSFYGKPSGLMDQLACAYGGVIEIDFKDNSNPIISSVNINFEDYGYVLATVDTKGKHGDLTDDYADIPHEMKQISSFFQKENLREVPEQLVYKNMSEIRKQHSDRAILRAIHYYKENLRVHEMLEALRDRDIQRYFQFVNKSGDSSYKYLQNIYSASNWKEQGVSLGLALTDVFLDGNGAYRVHGGGFAGTIQVYVPAKQYESYKKYIEQVFGESSCNRLVVRTQPIMQLL